MPFTPSHAVVALAFIRTPLVPAAVAVGAMTPDLPLFLRIGWPDYAMTHDLAGVPATTAIALVLVLVWRCLLRPAADDLLPTAIAGRLPSSWDRTMGESFRETWARPRDRSLRPTWSAGLLLMVALVIGVLSHIAWDVFTHEGRWGTELFPGLEAEWGPFPGYRWLQHGSSVIGLLILAVWAGMFLWRAVPHRVVRRTGRWVRVSLWVALPVMLAAAWLMGLAIWGPLTEGWTAAHLGYRVLPPAAAAWGALLLVTATTVTIRRSRRTNPRNSGGDGLRHARDGA